MTSLNPATKTKFLLASSRQPRKMDLIFSQALASYGEELLDRDDAPDDMYAPD
jgi:hypothetical protein